VLGIRRHPAREIPQFSRRTAPDVAYVRGGWRGVEAGHNPLGGWSAVALLLLLGLQAATGLCANDEIASAGPFYGWISHETSNRLTALHHGNANWLLALITLHVLAIASTNGDSANRCCGRWSPATSPPQLSRPAPGSGVRIRCAP
jgi:cytochrome b